jgi:hypothetical protein
MSQLSRRSLISSAAALPALAVPALALPHNPDAAVLPAMGTVNPNPDAHLLDLLKQYEAASKEVRLRCDEFNRIEEKKFDARRVAEEARPDVLRIRAEDKALGLPEPYRNSHKVGEFYELTDVERLREEKWERFKNVVIEPTDIVAVEQFLRRFELLHEVYTPTPEARARADEIIQASENWYAAYKPTRGLRAAERRRDVAFNKQDKLARKIAATKASTIAGMKAKARCVAIEFPGERITDLDDIHCRLAVSIMRDLSAMAA